MENWQKISVPPSIEYMNKYKREVCKFADGSYLMAFLDGIWLLGSNDRRLELVAEHNWMNAHMYQLEAA